MKINSIIVIGLACVVILVSAGLILYHTNQIEKQILQVNYEVAEKTGFNLDPGSFNFGRLMPGTSGTRNLYLHNEHDFPVKAQIIAHDSLRQVLLYNSSSIIMPANSNLTLPFSVSVPKNTKFGNYTGFISINIYKH